MTHSLLHNYRYYTIIISLLQKGNQLASNTIECEVIHRKVNCTYQFRTIESELSNPRRQTSRIPCKKKFIPIQLNLRRKTRLR